LNLVIFYTFLTFCNSNRHAVEDRDLWRKLTMTIARALRADSTRRQGSGDATPGRARANVYIMY